MNTNDADRLVTAWLESVAPGREPEHLLGTVLSRTARTRRRPAWRIPERWIPVATITSPVAAVRRAPWAPVAIVALLLLALVAGLVLYAGSRPTPLPAPFGPAANGTIVYSNGDLLSVDPATGATATLFAADGLEAVPAFSHDGTTVAWLEGADLDAVSWVLKTAGADGAETRTLGSFDHATGFTWSPAGDRIAVASEVDGREAITMVNIRTGAGTILPVDISMSQVAFRPPDGSQLLLRGREPDGTPGLYLLNADASGPLVHLDLDSGFESNDNYAGDIDYYFLDSSWSPDGTRLAFHTLEDSRVDPDPGFRVHLAEIDAGGTVTGEITLDPGIAVDDEFEPEWLPDGSGLLTHQVEEADHALVRWPIGERIADVGSPLALGIGRIRGNPTDFWFIVSPDGASALAWQAGKPAMLVPTSGQPASTTSHVISEGGTWQRTAPSAP